MRVIGIDPGLRTLGWGVVDAVGSRLSHVDNGQIKSSGDSLAARLLSLHDELREVIARLSPDHAAVEQTFVNKDATGTLKLGQARGIALLVPAAAGLDVAEYAPNHVKEISRRCRACGEGAGSAHGETAITRHQTGRGGRCRCFGNRHLSFLPPAVPASA